MPPPAAKTPQAAPMTISRILDVQTPNPARKSKSPPNLPTLTPQTPKTELSASPKLNAPSPIIPNINTPASFIFPATSDSMLVSSPSSQVSVIGISIGVTVAILFVFSAMGILYFRKRTRRATHQNRFFANVAHNEQIQNGPRLSKTYALKRTYSKQSKTNLNTIVRQSYADHNSAFRQNVSNIYSEENMIPFPPSAEMSSMESRYRSLPLPPLPQVQVVKSQPIAAEITGHRGAVDCSPRASSESAVTEEETDSRSIARQWLNKWISADEIENEATGSGIRTTPTPTLTTALKKKTFTFTFTFTKFPKPTSLIAAGENRKSSEPSSKVSTLGVAIGISVSLLFVIVSVGSLYFRNRTAQNQKVTPFVFSPGKNIKLESQGSDQFKSTPPVQKLDGNHDGKMYMAPNPPSQTPEQIPQRQPSFNQQANHVSIHQPQMSQYSFQPQSEARDDFTQQSIPAFQRPLNSLPLPMTSKPIQMPLPILESFTVVESSTNSTTESLSVVANRLMDKGSNEK